MMAVQSIKSKTENAFYFVHLTDTYRPDECKDGELSVFTLHSLQQD